MPQKVGVITFHCTDNPGSVLQAYALQQTVRSIGYECDVINYQKCGWKDRIINGFAGSIKRKTHLPLSLARMIAEKSVARCYVKYDAFRKEYMNVVPDKPIQTADEISSFGGNYAKIITGSDQVWNPGNPKVDETHFLSFAEKYQKIAYAVSFGTDDIEEKLKAKIAEWIADIPFLSVRETQGAEIVRNLTGREAQLVLDPSLLLTREQWSEVAKPPKCKDYILVYVRERRSKQFDEAVQRLSKQTGLKIVELTPYRSGTKIGKRIVCPGPLEWLGYIQNAAYVVTNSFHGMAFSINFGRQFYPVLLKAEPTNSRITGILEQFSLQDRIVTESTDFGAMQNIDYDAVNALLQIKREASMAFLKDALKGGSSNEGNAGSLQK